MFGNNGAAPSGAMMLLKTIGLDPAAIMQNVEAAKQTANEVMQHFDRRLQVIETRQSEILVLLGQVVSELKETTRSNPTKH